MSLSYETATHDRHARCSTSRFIYDMNMSYTYNTQEKNTCTDFYK